MKSLIKKLFLMQLEQGEIPEEVYHYLPEKERELLVEDKGGFVLADKYRKRIKVVITGGVFDIIHIGHIHTLNEAKEHGDVLVVSIANESHIKKKGREPVHTQDERKMIVESIKPVDAALVGFNDPKKMLKFVKPDIIVYGYDQKEFLKPKGVKIIKLSKRVDEARCKTGKILEKFGM